MQNAKNSFFQNLPWWNQRKKSEKKNMGDGGETFRLHFWNLHKIWIKESIDLNSI